MSPTSQHQKALFLSERQGQFILATHEVPVPEAGELLVRVQSTALNPVDWKIQAHGGFITEYPAVLGTDSAGTVEAVGTGVTSFAVGDRVYVAPIHC